MQGGALPCPFDHPHHAGFFQPDPGELAAEGFAHQPSEHVGGGGGSGAASGGVVAIGGGSSRGGKPFYASVVLAGDKLICVSRRGGTYVLAAKPEFEQLARNEFASDESDFNASPAISNRQLFLRSNRYLYCVEAE